MKGMHMQNQHLENAVELAKTLITIDTSRKRGLNKAMAYLGKWSVRRGLIATRLSGTNALLFETHPEVATKFLFVCHVDVVPAMGWQMAFQPVVRRGRLYGRGAVDDKGPLALCLSLLDKWKTNRDINVSCLVVTDEETVNCEIYQILSKHKLSPSCCLVVDGGTHTIFDIGQKGIIRFTVKIKTTGGHSAFEENSKSASLQLLRFLDALKTYAGKQSTDAHFQPTFINVSKFVTETVPYGLPTSAEAHFEIQFPPPQRLENWLSIIQKEKNRHPQTTLKINFTEVPHLVQDEQILNLIRQIPQASLVTVGGVNLAKDLNKAGIPAVGHCPVKTYMGHCDNEFIRLSDFQKGFQTYNELIIQFQKRKT